MKSHFTLPKDEPFFSRYATLTPTFNKLGIISQVVNALTEIGIIYAIIYSAVADFFPSLAPAAAVVGCILGTLLLEGGLRKLAPYSARAILYKRYKGLDGWMTGFIFAAVVGLYLTSGALSFQGSKTLVKSLASAPKAQSTHHADSVHHTTQAHALAVYRHDSAQVATRYADQVEAVRQAARSQIEAQKAELSTIESRERATNTLMTTRKKEIRAAIRKIEADRDGQLSAMEADKAADQAATMAAYKRDLESAAKAHQKATGKIEQANDTAQQRHETTVANTGGSLAWFTIVCHLVFALSIGLNEIHRKGSGIEQQPQPNQWHFSQSWIDDFTHMISDRFNYQVRTWIAAQAAKTPPPPPPGAPSTLWEMKDNGLPRRVIEYQDEEQPESVSGKPAQQPRRQIGFKSSLHRRPAPKSQSRSANASSINATVNGSHSGLQKECEHCGQSYTAKVGWQRFCSENCKLDWHEQRTGQRFVPGKRF